MKNGLHYLAGKIGLLPMVDAWKFRRALRRLEGPNRAFEQAHPDYATPPPELSFDAYNHIDWTYYRDSGIDQARFLAEVLRRHLPDRDPLDVLEWGCGPGRILRHLPDALTDHHLRLRGCDVNGASIAWCREHLPGIDFEVNGMGPPLPYPDHSMDCLIASSVFTHLSEAMHRAWAPDLFRVLRPGGVAIVSLHGEAFLHHLLPWERARYRRGDLVVRDQVREGKKAFAAFHPSRYVRGVLFPEQRVEEHITESTSHGMFQDIWVVRGIRP